VSTRLPAKLRAEIVEAADKGDVDRVELLLDGAASRARRDRGYNSALVRGWMRGTNMVADEFDADCLYQLACMYEHPPLVGGAATCYTYEVPSDFLDVPVPPAIVPGATAPPQRVFFNSWGCGLIIGIVGEVLDAATGLPVAPGVCNVQWRINSDKTINTDGEVPSFTSLGGLLRTSLPYFPWRRLVSSLDRADFIFQSNVAAGGINIIPRLSLAFGLMLQRRTE